MKYRNSTDGSPIQDVLKTNSEYGSAGFVSIIVYPGNLFGALLSLDDNRVICGYICEFQNETPRTEENGQTQNETSDSKSTSVMTRQQANGSFSGEMTYISRCISTNSFVPHILSGVSVQTFRNFWF